MLDQRDHPVYKDQEEPKARGVEMETQAQL